MSDEPKWVKDAIPSYEWKTRKDYKPENREAQWTAMQKKLTDLDLNDLKKQIGNVDESKLIDVLISINKSK